MKAEEIKEIEQMIHDYIDEYLAAGKSILQLSNISIMTEITLKAREKHPNFELNIDSFKLGTYYGVELGLRKIIEEQKKEE